MGSNPTSSAVGLTRALCWFYWRHHPRWLAVGCPFCAAPERFARAAELGLNCTAMLKTGHTVGLMVLTFGDAGVGRERTLSHC